MIGADFSVPSYISARSRRISQFAGSSPIIRGSILSHPSVTRYVTSKFSFLLAKFAAESPIADIPTSVRATLGRAATP